MQIRTERLILRRAVKSDLLAVNAYMGHPAAMRYWSTPRHATVDHTRTWLDAMMAAPHEISEDYLVEFDGQVIGEVGSHPLPDFGFIIHPDFWGKGIAHEASSAVIAHIFSSRPVESLTADVDPRNESSIRLLTKLGFCETGSAKRNLLVGDQWVDSVYFRLSRPTRRVSLATSRYSFCTEGTVGNRSRRA